MVSGVEKSTNFPVSLLPIPVRPLWGVNLTYRKHAIFEKIHISLTVSRVIPDEFSGVIFTGWASSVSSSLCIVHEDFIRFDVISLTSYEMLFGPTDLKITPIFRSSRALKCSTFPAIAQLAGHLKVPCGLLQDPGKKVHTNPNP